MLKRSQLSQIRSNLLQAGAVGRAFTMRVERTCFGVETPTNKVSVIEIEIEIVYNNTELTAAVSGRPRSNLL
jgi:polyisoprenoid-binding protein YceI